MILLAEQPATAQPPDTPPPVAPDNPGPSPLQQWIDNTIPPLPSAAQDPAAAQTALWKGILSPPTGDAAFDGWPGDLDTLQPGQIIETRDVTATTALRMPTPIRQSQLLKFRSTSASGTPSFGTATLITPAAAWTGPGPQPVEVIALPINALGAHCTPGYQFSHGLLDNPSTDLVVFLPSIWWALAQGHAVLVPDHEGPLMAYAEPNVAGHVMLDSIRATRALGSDQFGDSHFVMSGYSGGAIASYAAAMLLREYAPELADVVVGAAAGGVVTDNRDVAHRFNGNISSGILLSVALAVAREHPEMLPYMNHLAQWVGTSPLKDICGDADGPLGVVGFPMDVVANVGDSLNTPIANQMFDKLNLGDRTSAVPLYIYHGVWDPWIPLEDAQRTAREQCSRGVPAVFREVLGEHLTGYVTGSPGLDDWILARLRGEPAPTDC
ncbi:lipase family protein [Nocardia sp. alder85J]|uniref:lipase family protein n=1 Tax=Nocardia sp. alder85J TaxID=2862949 RepID=UPI001CD5BCA2|nr:lipase family protein [Nocardia sp. alder85J]MCX4099061.1 lipase family protein [Nocardia sp. alder85J]